MHLNPSDTNLIGETIIKLAADYLPEGGDVAILSASSTATNQNAWIEAAKKVLPEKFPKINLVATVYGDDDSVKSTNEAKGLIASHPNLKAIIAPTTVGVVAAAQVVTDQGLIGKVNVTGLALPSEFKQFIDNGAVAGRGAVEPDRPRLFGRLSRPRHRDQEGGSQAGRQAVDRPRRRGHARRHQLGARWLRPSSSTSRTSKSSPRSTDPGVSSATRRGFCPAVFLTRLLLGPETDHGHDSPAPGEQPVAASAGAAADAFGHHQELPRRARAARCQPVALSGPGDGADRRERRRQVDAGQDPDRHLPARRRRDQPSTASRSRSRSAHDAFEHGITAIHQETVLFDDLSGRREHLPRPRAAHALRHDRLEDACAASAREVLDDHACRPYRRRRAAEGSRHRQQASRRGGARHVDRRRRSSSWTSRRPRFRPRRSRSFSCSSSS